MQAKFFKTPADFRKWLNKNHKTEQELLVGFYKKGSGKASITWPESVDQALCFGWIDGIRRSIDEESYSIRFTPRRPKSIWSSVNIKKIAELTEKGLMLPEGIAAYERKQDHSSEIYSFEQDKKNIKLPAAFEKQFRSNKTAWKFFQSSPPSYRHPAIWWVISAKQEATRQRRMNTLIEDSEAGLRIKQFRR